MKFKLLTLWIIVFVAFFSLCTEEKLSAEELKSVVASMLESIETYKFDMKTSVSSVFGNESTLAEMVMTSSGSGLVDTTNRKMKMEMVTTVNIPGKGQQPLSETLMYLIKDEMYMKMELPGMPAQWLKMKMPESNWDKQNQLDQQMELLNFSEVELLQDEKVNGTDCYVLKLTPDMERLWEMVMSQQGLGEQMQGLEAMNIQDLIKSTSIKYWIAKDSKFPLKTVTEMELSFDEVMEEGENMTATMDMVVEVNYFDYNKPVDIELPAEAENAMELPETMT